MAKEKIVITADIAKKVMYLDCREEANVRRLKKSLMKLPFFKSEQDLNTDNFERVIKKLEQKYNVCLAYIMRTIVDDEYSYSGMIKTADEKSKWLITAYGQTIWETLAKAIFYMVFHIQKNK